MLFSKSVRSLTRTIIFTVAIFFASFTSHAQNVGIGTTHPASKLDVKGNETLGSGFSGIPAPTNGILVEGQAGLGTSSPNASAALDITATGQGVLFPRMTTAQRPTSPASSLMIYNTTTGCLEIYIGSSWQSIFCGCTTAPSAPTTITGTLSSLCKTPTTYTYSVPGAYGASSYTWAVTGDASATISGQGANTVTVTYSGTTGTAITAHASNSCGNSSAISSAISFLAPPSAPGTISPTGSVSGNNFCTGATATFSVTNVPGLTYNWTLPSGCTITAGSGTNSITVTLSSSIVSGGTVSVTASNCSGASSASTLTINIGTGGSPATPTISGYTVVGAAQTGVTYSVTPVSGVTYAWSVTGTGSGVISGSSTGSSITVNWSGTVGVSATNSINVTATNCLGNSTANLAVTAGGKTTFSSNGTTAWPTTPANSGVTSINIKLWGAGGGGSYGYTFVGAAGGGGAFTGGLLPISAATQYNVLVGQGGTGAGSPPATIGGGGSASGYTNNQGASGGGRSAFRNGANTSDLVTAGGGGGGGYASSSNYGGGGGAVNGVNGHCYSGSATGGGGGNNTTLTGTAGTDGTYSGTAGTQYTGGGGNTTNYAGGGGGGGYYGGGGGSGNYGSGGGGGSSYLGSLTSFTNTAGGTFTTTTTYPAGTYIPAGNNADSDYAGNAGCGGAYTTSSGSGYNGNDGLVIIKW